MSTERLKISGWAICTAHSWHVENASEQVFPAVIIQPLAGRIPNHSPIFSGEPNDGSRLWRFVFDDLSIK